MIGALIRFSSVTTFVWLLGLHFQGCEPSRCDRIFNCSEKEGDENSSCKDFCKECDTSDYQEEEAFKKCFTDKAAAKKAEVQAAGTKDLAAKEQSVGTATVDAKRAEAAKATAEAAKADTETKMKAQIAELDQITQAGAAKGAAAAPAGAAAAPATADGAKPAEQAQPAEQAKPAAEPAKEPAKEASFASVEKAFAEILPPPHDVTNGIRQHPVAAASFVVTGSGEQHTDPLADSIEEKEHNSKSVLAKRST